ncbi:MAG: tetratricopeptide repeat protein [Actinomycetota bacterium]
MPRPLNPKPKRQGLPARGTGLPSDVREELRRVAKRGAGERAAAALEKAVELLAKGDNSRAVAEAERAKALAPRSPAVREVLGLGYYGQERFREALSEMQAYRRISGRADQNHIIADAHRALGRPDKAAELAEEAVRAKIPDEAKAEAVVVGASALSDMGRTDQALALLHRFPTQSNLGRPFDLRIWYVTGDILDKAGRKEEAAKEFRKVVRHDSGAFDAAERLAQLG